MDLTSSWFLLLTFLMGGVVALLADHLGRIWGKKRLRLGKLRPRHTAMLFTALTGVATTFVTVVLVSALSAEVREWIVKGRGAVRDGQIAVQQLKANHAHLETTLRQKNEMQAQTKALEAKMKQLTARLAEANREFAKAQTKVRSAETQARTLGSKVGSLNREVAQGRQVLRSTQGKLAKANTSLKRTSTEFNLIQKNLKATIAASNDAFNYNLRIEKELQDAEKKLGSTNTNLNDARTALDRVNKEYQTANESFNRALETYRGELEELQNQLQEADALMRTAQSEVQRIFGASRDAPMIVSKGTEMARLEVRAVSTEAEAEAELRRLLQLASRNAKNLGAGEASDNMSAGLIVFEHNGVPVPPQQQMNDAVKSILKQSGPRLLVATALFNIFEGEFVALSIRSYANPVVFREGELIAEEKINGSGSDQQILNQLNEFMKSKVRQKALDRKMVAIGGREDAFGKVDPSQVVSLIQTLKNYDRVVRVQAIAKTDTRAAGPLNLEFRLR